MVFWLVELHNIVILKKRGDIMIRQANINDILQMEELITLSFGRRDDAISFRMHPDKYIVYIEGDKIVAMTGLVYNKQYRGLEIGWTCTHPDFRGMGLMHKLFEFMLKDVEERVYCSCWHLPNREHINLWKLMNDFNFICVTEARVSWVNGFNCHHNKTDNLCTECTGGACVCKEELWFRQANNE